MSAAPSRRALSRPASRGTGEGAILGVVHDLSDLTDRQVRFVEQHAGNLAANLVGYLPKRAAFGFQVPRQGPAGHRVEAGDHGSRAGLPEELNPKHALHL